MAAQLGQMAIQFVVDWTIKKAHSMGVGAQRRRFAAEKARRNAQRVDAEYSGGVEPRRRLYGNFKAGGLNVMPALVSGTNGEWLNKCLVLSDGEISSIDAYYFNNDRILASDVSAIDGSVTGSKYEDYALIFPYLGLASQTANSIAAALPGWDPQHRGDGVSYVYFRFTHAPDIYRAGVPEVMVEGQGALVYLPRDDTSPGANPTSGTYKGFSTNGPECLVDYLLWTSGGNESPANIDWDDVVECANAADESVTVPTADGSGTTTQPRFTCSTEVYAPLSTSERDNTIKLLASSFLGVCWFSGGKWRFRAGVYTTPVGTIVEDDFLGDDIEIETAQSRASGRSFNTVRGTYIDGNEGSQQRSYPEVSSSAYVTEDDEVLHGNIEYLCVRNQFEAQRNAIVELRLVRNRIAVTSLFRYRCRKFELYDIVTVTCSKAGWNARPARITAITQRQDFTVEMTLVEIESADFDDPDPEDYENSDDIAPPPSADPRPNAPRNLRVEQLTSAINVIWDPPLNAPVGVIYRVYAHTASTPFSSATQIAPDTAQTSLILPRTDTSLIYLWVVAIDPANGGVSVQSPATNGVPAGAATASADLGALVSPGSATATTFTSSGTTNSVTVTATNGDPGYTYAWAFTSGGTGLVIDSPTSATTTFSATGLAEGDSRTGTATCTVTDSSSAEVEVSVAVAIDRQFEVTLLSQIVSGNGGSMSAGVGTHVVASDGNVNVTPPATSYAWKDPAADAADYDCRITVTGGNVSPSSGSSASGAWVHLASPNACRLIVTRTPAEGPGTSYVDATVEIRMHSSPFTVLATASITVQGTIII